MLNIVKLLFINKMYYENFIAQQLKLHNLYSKTSVSF